MLAHRNPRERQVDIGWYCYILKSTKVDRHYVGITVNYAERLRVHNAGKGAKSTRPSVWRPWEYVYLEWVGSHSDALKREYAIRQLTQAERTALMDDWALWRTKQSMGLAG
jgi:putative endonuclease